MAQELFLTGMVSFVTSYSYLSQMEPSGQYNLAVAVVVSMIAAIGLHIVLDKTVFRNSCERIEQPKLEWDKAL